MVLIQVSELFLLPRTNKFSQHSIYPLVMTNSSLWKMTIEVVRFPSTKRDFPYSYGSLPEGRELFPTIMNVFGQILDLLADLFLIPLGWNAAFREPTGHTCWRGSLKILQLQAFRESSKKHVLFKMSKGRNSPFFHMFPLFPMEIAGFSSQIRREFSPVKSGQGDPPDVQGRTAILKVHAKEGASSEAAAAASAPVRLDWISLDWIR